MQKNIIKFIIKLFQNKNILQKFLISKNKINKIKNHLHI
jgi:hypothetical protein